MSDPIYYKFESADRYSVISLLPALNNAAWSDIEQRGSEILEQLEDRGKCPIVIDLSPLDYMGSAMVALIVRIWKWAETQSIQMIVINDDATVHEVMEIAGLTKVWNVVSTREQAVVQFDSSVRRVVSEQAPVWLTLTAALAAIAAAIFFLLDRSDIVNHRIALPVKFGGLAYGIIVGTLSAVRGRGIWRAIGILLTVICCVMGVIGAFYL